MAAVCGALALSAPARADQYDFISFLDRSGVSYESIGNMIDVGKEVCHDLRSGAAPPVVLDKLSNTGFAPAEAALVLVSAVTNMCIDAKPEVLAWAGGGGYTVPTLRLS